MTAATSLEGMGLALSRVVGGGLALEGLKDLSPEKRKAALCLARKHKKAILWELERRERFNHRCLYCFRWQSISGGCWWVGKCAVTGKEMGHKSVCTVLSGGVLQ